MRFRTTRIQRRGTAILNRIKANRLALLLALIPASSVAPSMAEVDWHTTSNALQDPLSLLAGRSPGARDPSGLIQTKAARRSAVLAQATLPPEWSAPAPFAGPGLPVPAMPAAEAPAALPVLPGAADPTVAALPAQDAIPGAPGTWSTGGISPILFLPVPLGEPKPVTPISPPAAPVPDAPTWLTLIAGFVLLGGALRHKGKPLHV